VIRFEGLPGEYVQWDWGEARVRLGGALLKRVFLAGRLKYSRVSGGPGWIWRRSCARWAPLARGTGQLPPVADDSGTEQCSTVLFILVPPGGCE
jgi:hypothetical protein